MNQLSEREIRDLLTPKDAPAPPAGLAERIKNEIPEHLEAAPEGDAARFGRRSPVRTYLLAAGVLMAVGGAFLAYRVQEEMRPEAPLVEETVRDVERTVKDDEAAPRTEAESSSLASADADETSAPEPAAVAPERQRRLAKESAKLRAIAEPPASEGGERATVQAVQPPPPPPPSSGADRASIVEQREELAAAYRRQLQEKARTLPYEQPATVAEGETLTAAAEGRRSRDTLGRTFRLEPQLEPRPQPAPPNDAPYDAVYFQDYGTQPFVDTEDDALSTFALDVDTASYAVVRRFLRDGHLPPPAAVRVEELINYFDYGDRPPRRGDFAIYAEGAPSPFGEGERYYLLRFHLRGRDLEPGDRRPADLIFVVDVSGSMARENRLGLVRTALEMLLDNLRDDDRVGLVVYGTQGRVVLEPTADHERARRALDALRPEGSTNAEEGLRLAYELAARTRRGGTVSRLVLCSDGVANVGRTSAEGILDQVRDYRRRGIELTTVGFGMGNYNDVLMEQLADRGNGRYAYVDTVGEAHRLFVESLTGTLQTIAAEARVQVDFNPDVVSRYRLVGYENREVADERFRDDTVDAGEIGAGHAVTALYELKLHGPLRRRDEVATLHLRYGSVVEGEMMEMDRRVTGQDFARAWDDASAALRLTSLVAELGEILKGSYWARTGDLGEVFRRAQRVAVEYPGDADVAELASLIGRAAEHRR